MYTETGILHPYFQNFSQEFQQLELEELCHSQKTLSSMMTTFVVFPSDVVIQQKSSSSYSGNSVSEYDLGGEGDLFGAPKPIIEEPVMSFDPILDAMKSTTSMISCDDEFMPTEGLEVGALDSLQNAQLLNEFFRDSKKDLFGSMVTDSPIFEIFDFKLPATATNEIQIEEKFMTDSAFQKSVSSGCLSSMEWVSGNSAKPSVFDFSELDFGASYGMRRSFSEGDIKTLGNGNVNAIHSPVPRPLGIGGCTSEDRLQKLCRYRNKRSRRNFGRKIKYACRKALADSQPRIRGRFAKTEEPDLPRGQ